MKHSHRETHRCTNEQSMKILSEFLDKTINVNFLKGMFQGVHLFCKNTLNYSKVRSIDKLFAQCWCLWCMFFHVIPQISSLSACIITFLASNGLLASVGKHVPPQTNCFPTRVTALIADKGLFFSMLPHVCLESTSTVAWIVALVTIETLLPWMCWHVLFEVILSCEGRDTLGARKLFFPWMSE